MKFSISQRLWKYMIHLITSCNLLGVPLFYPKWVRYRLKEIISKETE